VVSIVWNYFELRNESGRVVYEDKSVVELVSEKFQLKEKALVYNLMVHLREYHADIHSVFTEAMTLNH